MQNDTEGTLPLSDEDGRDERISPVEVEAAKARPPSRHKRLWQVGIALATVLAVLVVFRGVYAPRQAPVSPAPTERPAPLPPLALFASNVNFGAMIINNKLFEKQPVLLPVPQDTYTVTLAASPFHPIMCHVSHLRAPEPDIGPDQHCQLESGITGVPTMTRNGITGSPTFIISILLGLDDLPPEQQAAVRSTIIAQVFTLRQQTTVPVGDYYAAAVDQKGSITSQRATRPLQAEVSLVPPRGMVNNGYFCGNDLACAGPIDPVFFPTSPAREWLLQVNAAIRWRFTTSAGQVMGEAAYGFLNSTYRYFSYDATNGWQLDEAATQMFEPPDELSNDNCAAGANILQSLIQGGISYNYDRPSIGGCFVTVDNGQTSQRQLLWRFGVLLAVDQPAHISFPTLPLAPKQEVDAVGG
jgi:hypothetical protein